MAVQCPQCLRQKTLRSEASIELPSDSRSDEISLQLVRCLGCGLYGVSIYEESRRGALDSESVDFRIWRVEKETYRDLLLQIKSCPDRLNPRCSCPAHRQLGQRDQQGRWVGPPVLYKGHQ